MLLRCIVLSHTVFHAILQKPQSSRNNIPDPAEVCLKCVDPYPMEMQPTALPFLLPGRTSAHILPYPALHEHGILPGWASAPAFPFLECFAHIQRGPFSPILDTSSSLLSPASLTVLITSDSREHGCISLVLSS